MYAGSPRPNTEWSLEWSIKGSPYYQQAKFGVWTSCYIYIFTCTYVFTCMWLSSCKHWCRTNIHKPPPEGTYIFHLHSQLWRCWSHLGALPPTPGPGTSIGVQRLESMKNMAGQFFFCDILLMDVWNPINNGKNYQPQLVQDFSHQQ